MCTRWAESGRTAYAVALFASIAFTLLATASPRADGYPTRFSFGETATEQDIARIAIAIPADGKGLPPGRGGYARGKEVYEVACAACHCASAASASRCDTAPAFSRSR